jgi:hypothetical protein
VTKSLASDRRATTPNLHLHLHLHLHQRLQQLMIGPGGQDHFSKTRSFVRSFLLRTYPKRTTRAPIVIFWKVFPSAEWRIGHRVLQHAEGLVLRTVTRLRFGFSHAGIRGPWEHSALLRIADPSVSFPGDSSAACCVSYSHRTHIWGLGTLEPAAQSLTPRQHYPLCW